MDTPSSPEADEYRKLADEADRRAETATRAEIREVHRQLASNWREMARHVDSRNEALTPRSEQLPV
jgi:uncharacterized coiled-coil DUF342 family protein